MRIAVLGGGAGGAATAAEMIPRGHEVALWSRSAATIAPFKAAGGIRHEGVMGSGLARAGRMTTNLAEACEGAEAAIIALPTHAHGPLARDLADAGWPAGRPIVLNPGHTGGALEFDAAFRERRADAPPVAELSTLTYVARKYAPDCVTVTGRARQVRAAALPGGEAALSLAADLFPSAEVAGDVLACDLSNVNMVLHPPGAVLGAAWVEATGGDFTFYVDAMTPGVARVMRGLDDERRAVAHAFGHDLPSLIGEMKRIGTVEADAADTGEYAAPIAGGEANRRIKAPDSFAHRYYREDFGHGLLPFLAFAAIAGVETPVARSLYAIAEAMTGTDYRAGGRTAAAMGIAGLGKAQLLERVGRRCH